MKGLSMSTTVFPEEMTESETRTRRQPPYHVILINDDDHTYNYVIRMLKELFAHSDDVAFKMAEEVDKKGRVIVCTTSLERAELKQDQIHSYGADPLLPRCQGSMTAELEAAE